MSLLFKDFHEEHAIQAFRKFDTKSNGHILASNFKTILVQLKSHLLSPYVKDNIETVKLIKQNITQLNSDYCVNNF